MNFRHHAVRDLAWVIGSPGILSSGLIDRVSDHWCRIAFLDRVPWLRHLDNHPAELEMWLAQHQSSFLGHYFETLIAFWLTQWPRTQLLAWRLPLQGDERVLGEFDLLFYDRYCERHFHWESAVKFFLRYRNEAGDEIWLGPNPRDTLTDKFQKIFGRQLRLSRQSEAAVLLQQYGITGLTPQAFFKGYLFYPAQSAWQQPSSVPPESSPTHLRGWWCYASQPEQIPYVANDSRWLSLERLRWLSPVFSHEREPGLPRAGLEALLARHFSGTDRPLLLAELQPGSDGSWREVNRGFVVPAHWPESNVSLPSDTMKS
ncbi:MAG: DUF1853 family protein [Gammaproteobacteria bacterium]|nr:DUF1853 family protein [Gammaproteobacteria bacterium]MCW8839369.1 DUF1853 family protein [Gammaproteobacteria bacterium]MCW8928103.1 DUF1853 family protein [Gammaproteobacteria bacterium]MCW8959578.1 DUF1853 family protein [Gammaproteobacteria bacterium]MCW8972270.1 DUF1853 family protein [Gammaproteobacteria bacterium]